MQPGQLGLFILVLLMPDGKSDTIPSAGRYSVSAVKNVQYRPLADGEDDRQAKNRLDLYLPRQHREFPVLFFVHGGGWRSGDKDFLGFYGNFATFLARQGVGVVVCNYRLSPAVQHPEHIKDVAAAFAWTHQNIARYGGSPKQIYACGHSAGGHLVALLATDPTYLQAHGLTPAAIRGVISISGVYDVTFSGIRLLTSAFGEDARRRRQASPLAHVRGGEPPFLIIYADQDFPFCDVMSEQFAQALRNQQGKVRVLRVKDRNHFTILLNAARLGDPVLQALTEFIAATAPQAAGPMSGGR